jgi:hypothetical protein
MQLRNLGIGIDRFMKNKIIGFFIGVFLSILCFFIIFKNRDIGISNLVFDRLVDEDGVKYVFHYKLPDRWNDLGEFVSISIHDYEDGFSAFLLTPNFSSLEYEIHPQRSGNNNYISFFNENLDGFFDFTKNGEWDLYYKIESRSFFILIDDDYVELLGFPILTSLPVLATSVSNENFIFDYSKSSWKHKPISKSN